MADIADFNHTVTEEFRANDGRVGGPFEGRPLLLLHTLGSKSGKEYVNPLAYLDLDGSIAVFASKGGAPTNPDWYRNLVAHPDVTVEIGTTLRRCRARTAAGDERERFWTAQKRVWPGFADYEAKAGREIPVVILEPVEP